MRTLEERKNQMMIKLIEVVDPIVNELGKLLDNERIVKIVNGLVKFLTDVAPIWQI